MKKISFVKTWKPVFEGDPDLVSELSNELEQISDKESPQYKRTSTLLEAAKTYAAAKEGKLLPQEKVNTLIADSKRKHQEAHQRTLDELNAIKARSNLTADEKAELERRIEETQATLRTKEELSKQATDKLIKKHESELSQVTKDRDSWKSRFTTTQIKQNITTAASLNNPKAVNPAQILAILEPATRLVEATDDSGKPTGDFISQVTFRDKDKDGKPLELKLSPEDAVKRMSEMDEYLNLFDVDGKGGFGKNRAAAGKEIDVKTLAKDPEAYREARKSGTLKI